VASKDTILAKMAVIIDAQTAAFDKKLASSSKNFDSFGKSVSKVAVGIAAGFGLTNVIDKFTAAVQNGFHVMAEFEATMSEVKAITGATGDEFQKLEKDALRLGASTKFTATQVGQLQVAYGRLGFTTKEILAATKATLDLAAATGEDLAKSADVAGSTVRGFGLDASETQRVVDVMASSFNKTALGLDNFTESMKYVAPVAAAAGATVEETTALLGTLADAGIRGSMAGTSLRKIFTDMSKDGRPLQVRLAELAAKGITMADAFDEVGRTAQTSLLILANNTDKTNKLAEAFKNVEGEAAKMARTMSDNLTGDVVKFTSAWDGLILKIGNSEPWRRAVQAATSLINTLSGASDMDEQLRILAKFIQQTGGKVNFDKMIESLKALRREAGQPIDTNIVQELAEKYKLTDDEANKLYQSVLEINKALSFQERVIKDVNDFAKQNGYAELSQAVEAYKQKIYELLLAELTQLETLKKYTPELTKDIAARQNQVATYRRVITVLAEYGQGLEKVTKTQTEAAVTAKTYANTIDGFQDRLKDLNDAFEATNINDSGRLRTLAREINAVEQLIARLQMVKKLEAVDDVTFSPKTLNKGKSGSGFLEAMGLDSESIQKSIDAAVAKIKGLAPPPEVKEAWLDFGSAISNSISTVADAFGQAIVGVGNFGDAILRALAGFARQIGETLIGIGVAILAAKKAISNPITAIAAGVALVALAGALSTSLNKAQSGFNGGGRSSSANSSAERISPRQTGVRIEIGGTLTAEGNTIVALIKEVVKQEQVKRG
jgi:phage-related minor tail protein